MRDETKEELRADENLMDEIRGAYISENKAALVDEAKQQAAEEISEIKSTLSVETRKLEGKIALEKRINAMEDGVKENTLFKTVTIKFDGTKEEAMTVINAAKDRDNAKKARDKAVADKDKAVKERNEAVKARERAEKEKAAAEKKAAEANAAASEAIATANALKSEAASEIKKAQSLYYQQTNLNALYRQAVSDRDRFKVMADKAAEMEAVMKGAYSNVGIMAKAINAILYDPALIIEGLTPPQERLLKAIPNYAVTWAKKAGLTEIAEDIEKHYEISPGI